jgi:hypothetical protein
MLGENSCIFAGTTKNIKVFKGEAEHGPWVMTRLSLVLAPSAEFSQEIKLIAWNSIAERLESIGEGKPIKVLTWYNPSMYMGKLQDTFEIDSLVDLK